MTHKDETDMPIQSTNQSKIEQLRREIAAVAEEMSRPPPTVARAFLLPFCIGAAFTLTVFIAMVFFARLI